MTPSAPPSLVTVDESVTVRLATDEDLDTLAAWFADPAIYEFWGGQPIAREAVAERYLGKRAEVTSYVIEQDSTPVGYIQFWDDGHDPARGLDMFLTPSTRGRGLGPRVALALAVALTAAGYDDLTVDPKVSNPGAIAAWGRAGFLDSGRTSTDDGEPTIIMVFSQ